MAEITVEALRIQILQLISPAAVQIGVAILMLTTALITRSLTQRHIIRYHLGDVVQPQLDLRNAKIHELETEARELRIENSQLRSMIKSAVAELWLPAKAVKPKLKAVGK